MTMIDIQSSPASQERRQNLRRLLLSALLLSSLPLPLMVTLQFHGGGVGDALLAVVTWVTASTIYWIPLSSLLTLWERGVIVRYASAWIVSVPLFFLSLIAAYPGMGARFGPSSEDAWVAYLSAGPWIFVYVLVLSFLVRNEGRLARITKRLLTGAFLLCMAAPLLLLSRVDHYDWPENGGPGDLRIVGPRIVQVAERTLLEGHDVVIRGGRIDALVPTGVELSGLPEIDARGRYLIPGLIDVHAHLEVPVAQATAGFDTWFFFEAIVTGFAQNRRAYLENGVTTIRDLGGVAKSIYATRSSVAEHSTLGPRILAAGRLVSSPGGHPDSTIWMPRLTARGAILAEDEETMFEDLEENYRDGPPDVVKIVYGTIGRNVTRLSEPLMIQAIKWAETKGLPSAVHAETTEEVTAAVRAGATGVEHAASIDSLPESLIREMVMHGTYVDPTFGELEAAMQLRGAPEEDIEVRMRQAHQTIKRMFDAGVHLVAGSDTPLAPYGDGLVRELEHFSLAGVPAAEVLAIATVNNANYLGLGGELGRVEAGFLADLVLLDKNPLESVEALRKIRHVLRDGVVVVDFETAGSR